MGPTDSVHLKTAPCTSDACYDIHSAPFLSLSQGFHRHAGAESLSDKERDLYSNLVQELKSDGTLSSEISDLFTYMSMTPSQDLRCSPCLAGLQDMHHVSQQQP